MLRPRNAEQIRTDALKTAIRKAKIGCYSCAQGYFELAKKHGATEEEISRTITTAVDSSEPGINRRLLLQLAAALVAGATLDVHELLPHRAETSSYYWGTDSNSASMMGVPQNFYIGHFGSGTSGSAYFFNTRAARMAGKSSTYMYWGLEGPRSAPSDITPYRWGGNGLPLRSIRGITIPPRYLLAGTPSLPISKSGLVAGPQGIPRTLSISRSCRVSWTG